MAIPFPSGLQAGPDPRPAVFDAGWKLGKRRAGGGAGTGLDFSKASVVVFVELPHEVSLVRQAEDRAHRRGQLSPVNVYFLVSRGTTDEHRSGPQSLAHPAISPTAAMPLMSERTLA